MEVAARPRSSRVRRVWRRVVRFNREWSAVGPTVFAVVAIALLVYNHFEQQVTDLVFWLGLALIGSVFTWLLQNNHEASRLDSITGLPNRLKLRDDIAEALHSHHPETARRALVLLELADLGVYQERFGFEAADLMLQKRGRALQEIVEQLGGSAYHMDAGRFSALLPTHGRQTGELVMAITVAVDDEDEGSADYWPHGAVTVPDDATDPDVAMMLAGERLASHNQRQRRSAKRQANDALIAVLGSRRPELLEHMRAVAFRAISIGRLLRLGQSELDDVVSAAKLQNIGLITVPDSVLDKETALSTAEIQLIRKHPTAGERIIAAAPAMASVATLVRSSCEHYDGTGYPDGLAGEAIPLGSRIVAVCVAFTALTHKRPYHAAVSAREALAELRRCAGAQFDPQVVEALARDVADDVPAPRAPGGPNGMSEAKLSLAGR